MKGSLKISRCRRLITGSDPNLNDCSDWSPVDLTRPLGRQFKALQLMLLLIVTTGRLLYLTLVSKQLSDVTGLRWQSGRETLDQNARKVR
jgi:hypothetical protein